MLNSTACIQNGQLLPTAFFSQRVLRVLESSWVDFLAGLCTVFRLPLCLTEWISQYRHLSLVALFYLLLCYVQAVYLIFMCMCVCWCVCACVAVALCARQRLRPGLQRCVDPHWLCYDKRTPVLGVHWQWQWRGLWYHASYDEVGPRSYYVACNVHVQLAAQMSATCACSIEQIVIIGVPYFWLVCSTAFHYGLSSLHLNAPWWLRVVAASFPMCHKCHHLTVWRCISDESWLAKSHNPHSNMHCILDD